MKVCPYISSTSLLGGRQVRLGLGEAGASRGLDEWWLVRRRSAGGGAGVGGEAGAVGGSWTVAGGAVGMAGRYVTQVGGLG